MPYSGSPNIGLAVAGGNINIGLDETTLVEALLKRGLVLPDAQKHKLIEIAKKLRRNVGSVEEALELIEKAVQDSPSSFPTWNDSLPEFLVRLGRSTAQVYSEDVSATCVIITPDGFAVSAAHLLSNHDVEYIEVSEWGEATRRRARVRLVDEYVDFAVIKIDSEKRFIPLDITLQDTLVGDKVIVLGSRFNNYTTQIGSVTGRSIFPYSRVFLDVPTVPGMSGSPIVTDRGSALGVVLGAVHSRNGFWSTYGATFQSIYAKVFDSIGH